MRILEYERPEGFITHARALFLGSIAHGEEKNGRQAGGREKGSRNEKKRKKKEKRKEDRYRAPWNFTNERSQLTWEVPRNYAEGKFHESRQGIGSGRRGEGKAEKGEPGENMLGAALGRENKWAPPTRLLLQNSCEARRESTQSRLKIHNTRARMFNPRRRRLPERGA